jgi:uncharacterized protein
MARRIFFVFVLLYLACTILGGIGLGWIALHPPSARLIPSEERNAQAAAREAGVEFRDAEITAADGVTLRGWFMRPAQANGDAVILLHGVSDNRMGMYGFGKWLVANHYSVLIPDARGHSLSGGFVTYGLKEADDIHRWVDWLEANEHPNCMYGLGESLGAAELLQALPKEPRLCAVVAESPFASFREVAYARLGWPFHAGPWLGRTILRPTVEVGILYVRWKYGLNLEDASPAEAVARVYTPVLLIHGLNDTNIPPYHSDLIQARNPVSVVVWKVPGAVHTQAHRAAPEEFDRRVLEWLRLPPVKLVKQQ